MALGCPRGAAYELRRLPGPRVGTASWFAVGIAPASVHVEAVLAHLRWRFFFASHEASALHSLPFHNLEDSCHRLSAAPLLLIRWRPGHTRHQEQHRRQPAAR